MIKRIELVTLKEHPRLTFDAPDIKIIAEHYGYDYAQYAVEGCGFNGNQTCIFNFCLINEDGEIIEDLDWRTDMVLLRKFYDFDMQYGFIEKSMTFEEFSKRIQN